MAFGVDDVAAVADHLRRRHPCPVRHEDRNRRLLVNFVHPKDCGGVLVELVQAADH